MDEKKEKAIEYLSEYFPEELKVEIRYVMNEYGEDWIAPYHFGWGMSIRNKLRDSGFGEEFFEINNLDDIYVELIEAAVKQ